MLQKIQTLAEEVLARGELSLRVFALRYPIYYQIGGHLGNPSVSSDPRGFSAGVYKVHGRFSAHHRDHHDSSF